MLNLRACSIDRISESEQTEQSLEITDLGVRSFAITKKST